ncbi:MAG: glutamine-hydrolyzing GMP synthase, partial [Candidatus Omnitrophota bacterium]
MQTILIIDYGSQYNQLIARRVREARVFCEVAPPTITLEQIRTKDQVRGIILSGGPASVYQKDAPKLNPDYLKLGVPVLGICYGMQALTALLGGKVARAHSREYGHARLRVRRRRSGLFKNLPSSFDCWMSHGDHVDLAPEGFVVTADTKSTRVAAFENAERGIYGVQFHPEVAHTEHGGAILGNFLDLCGCDRSWTMENFIRETCQKI